MGSTAVVRCYSKSPGRAGFVNDITGMAANDRRELDYTLPETWWDPKMVGTQVVCHVLLKELFMWELPKVLVQPQTSPCATYSSIKASIELVSMFDMELRAHQYRSK